MRAEQFWNWYGALRRENTWVLELVEVPELQVIAIKVMPCCRQLVTSVLVKRSGFSLRPVCVGFVVYKVALDHVFVSVVQMTLVTVRPPMLHSHKFTYH